MGQLVVISRHVKTDLVVGLEARQRLITSLQIHIDDDSALDASYHAINIFGSVTNMHSSMVVFVTCRRNGLPDDCLRSLLSIFLNIVCIVVVVGDGLILFVTQQLIKLVLGTSGCLIQFGCRDSLQLSDHVIITNDLKQSLINKFRNNSGNVLEVFRCDITPAARVLSKELGQQNMIVVTRKLFATTAFVYLDGDLAKSSRPVPGLTDFHDPRCHLLLSYLELRIRIGLGTGDRIGVRNRFRMADYGPSMSFRSHGVRIGEVEVVHVCP